MVKDEQEIENIVRKRGLMKTLSDPNDPLGT
jgi:hypothetical protein